MSELNLNNMDKQDIQKFFNNAQSLKKHEVDAFKSQFSHGNQAAWHRFLVGVYNHPLTWWIGIIQLQMQMGIWGHQYKSMASIRANLLWQITAPLRKEVRNAVHGDSMPIVSTIVKYNLKHHKADILGRLALVVFLQIMLVQVADLVINGFLKAQNTSGQLLTLDWLVMVLPYRQL